jgi:hypothetical protein
MRCILTVLTARVTIGLSSPVPRLKNEPCIAWWEADGGTRGDGNDEPRPCRGRSAHRGAGLAAVAPGWCRRERVQEKALRRALYSLSAVVRVHFAKEEEIYLPILDAGLTPKEAHRMFEAMEKRRKRQRAPWGNDPRYRTNVLRGRVFYALKHTVGVKHPRYVTLVALPRTALGRVAHVP